MDWPLPIVDPSELDLSREHVHMLDQRMKRYVDSGHVAGLMCLIARRGKIAYAACHGYLDIKQDRLLQFDSLYRIYSNTKIVCAVAVLILYEQGLIQLNDPVSKYIPAFKDVFLEDKEGVRRNPQRPVSIHDLLVHVGGLSYDFVHQARREKWSHDKFIEKFVQTPLLSEPGRQWNYSASNDVLGILIEKVTGMSIPEYCSTHIFTPLGMHETMWYVSAAYQDRFGPVYRPKQTGILEEDAELNANLFVEQPTFYSLGGGLVSTASDYLRFSQMLLNGGYLGDMRILSRKTVALMSSDHLPPQHPDLDVNQERYGLSVEVLSDLGRTQRLGSVGEFGWGGAAGTQVWIDPQEDMISLIMMQIFGQQEPLQRSFRAMSCACIR